MYLNKQRKKRMLANVKIYLNNEFVDVTDLELQENETVESPNVVLQATNLLGDRAWDRIEIQHFYD
jgi:hypothetical protein